MQKLAYLAPYQCTSPSLILEGIVLEPVNNGAFKIYDSIGVMTNSPEYSWHLNNLRNYVQMRPHNVGENKLNDQLVIKQIESGSGLLGLHSALSFYSGNFSVKLH